jgi:hypothetical protein
MQHKLKGKLKQKGKKNLKQQKNFGQKRKKEKDDAEAKKA